MINEEYLLTWQDIQWALKNLTRQYHQQKTFQVKVLFTVADIKYASQSQLIYHDVMCQWRAIYYSIWLRIFLYISFICVNLSSFLKQMKKLLKNSLNFCSYTHLKQYNLMNNQVENIESIILKEPLLSRPRQRSVLCVPRFRSLTVHAG